MPGIVSLPKDQAEKITKALFELKVDGTRITYKNGNIVSDRDINRNARYGHVVEELKKLNWHVRGEMALPGGTSTDVSKSENWPKAKFYAFDLFALNGENVEHVSIAERRDELEKLVKQGGFRHIEVPLLFKTFTEGWQYVEANDAEGIVIKEPYAIWKVKKLKELKLPIVEHMAGKSKGAFMIALPNGEVSKVSGTSQAYIDTYNRLIAAGEKPYAEIECQHLTEYGVPYQPRLRRIGTVEQLKIS